MTKQRMILMRLFYYPRKTEGVEFTLWRYGFLFKPGRVEGLRCIMISYLPHDQWRAKRMVQEAIREGEVCTKSELREIVSRPSH